MSEFPDCQYLLYWATGVGGEAPYRKADADDCTFGTRHWIGEHGKSCQACGAEQIWVVPVEREVRE